MKYSIILSLLVICALACVKDKSIEKGVSNASEFRTQEVPYPFTNQDIENVGDVHNRMVGAFLDTQYDGESVDWNELIAFIGSTDVPEFDLEQFTSDSDTLSIIENQVFNGTYSLLETYISGDSLSSVKHLTPISSALLQYFEEFESVFDSIVDYASLENELNEIKSSAFASLNETELVSFLITIEVAKKSAYLWMPQELGGLDYIRKMPGSDNITLRAWNWKKFIRNTVSADAWGAYTGFVRGVMVLSVATASPVGAAALASSAAFGAVAGSVLTGTLTALEMRHG